MGLNSGGHQIEILPLFCKGYETLKNFSFVFLHFSDEKWYAIEIEDMNDIWYPLIYIGNGLKFKSQESLGPEPKSLNMLW